MFFIEFRGSDVYWHYEIILGNWFSFCFDKKADWTHMYEYDFFLRIGKKTIHRNWFSDNMK